jgi:AcrR family transcriptional regulator
MGRHALVDRDAALDRIMWQFWQTGYEASSIEDLLEASGLQRQSFYRAFGDKYRAFKLALERYTEQGTSGYIERALAGGDSPTRRLLRLLYLRLDVGPRRDTGRERNHRCSTGLPYSSTLQLRWGPMIRRFTQLLTRA